jgi:hypothetical protein
MVGICGVEDSSKQKVTEKFTMKNYVTLWGWVACTPIEEWTDYPTDIELFSTNDSKLRRPPYLK